MDEIGNVGTGKRGTKLVEKPGGTHAKQPKGKSIGASPGGAPHPGASAPATPGFIGHKDRGSSMISEGGAEHANQPAGKSIGYTSTGGAEHHKGSGMGGAPHAFKGSASEGSHSFGHAAHQRSGHHRLSGSSGAHRIGKR